MSYLVKQRNGLSNRAMVSIVIAIISMLAITVGTIAVFALRKVDFNSSVKISYKAIDIAGGVTMYAKAAPNTENYTGTEEENKIGSFNFLPTTDTSSNPAGIDIDKIDLDSKDNTLYLHYVFDNQGSRSYTATLDLLETDIKVKENITIQYSEEGTADSYQSLNSGLVVPGHDSKDYYVKISVTDLSFNADFDGIFTWRLKECDRSLTIMEEKSLNATTFKLIDEGNNLYSASYNGKDISYTQISDMMSAQSVGNLWYVPHKIDLGRVVSIVKGELLPINSKVHLAEGIERIGSDAFENNKGLVQIIMPNSITQIFPSAFSNCSELVLITMPSSLLYINAQAFYNCSKLVGVTDENGYLLSYGLDIPNGVVRLDSQAFAYCSSLISLTIPQSLATIGFSAFNGCENVQHITISEGVTEVNDSAFYGCKNLTRIEIPSTITAIGQGAFANCNKLQSIEIDPNNTSLKLVNNCLISGSVLIFAFNNTSEIVIPADGSVTEIGDYAFEGLDNLKKITIPKQVLSIGTMAFAGCSNLEEINVDSNNKQFKVVGNCLINYLFYKTLIVAAKNFSIPTDGSVVRIGSGAFVNRQDITQISIPNSVTNIDSSAFLNCKNLTKVTLTNSITTIGKSAFEGCESLQSIIIPDSVEVIRDGTFNGCSSLSEVVIGAAVEVIGESFVGCTSLTSVQFKSPTGWYGKSEQGQQAADPIGENLSDKSVAADCLANKYVYGMSKSEYFNPNEK